MKLLVLNGSEAFENTVEDVAGPVAENGMRCHPAFV